MTKEIIDEVAVASEGFSGREMTKMVIAWHDAAFTLPDACLTPDLMKKVLAKFHLQHKLKDTWTIDEAKIMEKLMFLDEDVGTGSVDTSSLKKDEDMLKRQESLMGEINQERMDLKD